jgi:hypothetical protein
MDRVQRELSVSEVVQDGDEFLQRASMPSPADLAATLDRPGFQ